jgi:transposase
MLILHIFITQQDLSGLTGSGRVAGAGVMNGIPADEAEAEKFLLEAGVLRPASRCPKCRGPGVRQIRRKRYRCRDCMYEWGIRKGSILEGLRISYRTFIAITQFFAGNISANDAASRLGIAYNTVYEVYRRIRSAVQANDLSAEACPGARPEPAGTNNLIPVTGTHQGKKQMVFGIRMSNGSVTVAEVNCPDPEIIIALPIPTMQRGNILFIDAYGKKYQGFITYVPERHGQGLVRIRARDGLLWSPLGDFWDFAGKTWMSHRGLDRESIPAFVHELAFRYNHRNADMFRAILEKIQKSYAGPGETAVPETADIPQA